MNWVPPSFDRFQFAGKRTKAVSARKTRTGWDTTGISFGDLQVSMHVHRRERVQERRLCTPKWAVRDEWFRELLVTYLEERFYIRSHHGLTLVERLARARNAAIEDAPAKLETLHDMRRQYRALRESENKDMSDDAALLNWAECHKGQQTFDPDYARHWLAQKKLYDLEIQMQNIDTDLVLTDRGHAEVVNAIVYLYYRLGWDSVTVAEQLRLKPPHVRQVLARLHATWTDSLSLKFQTVTGSHSEGAEKASIENPPSVAVEGDTSALPYEPLAALFAPEEEAH